MFPIKHSWIFRSRWIALLWAAGIIWFALDVTGSLDQPATTANGETEITDVTGTTLTGKDAEKAVAVLRDWGGK